MKELTLEITNYCPHSCPYCSSDTTKDRFAAIILELVTIQNNLDSLTDNKTNLFDRINISGGEPLSHPQFYDILLLCKKYSKSVALYTNAIEWIFFNANVIDGVTIDANLTVKPNTNNIHILKRISQGRENKRPETIYSKNFDKTNPCNKCEQCNHIYIRPNGKKANGPCDKYNYKE